jgi:hypothetical protein
MIRLKNSDQKKLLGLLQPAVTTQVQLYDQLSAIEEVTGPVTGLDAWILREAADYDKSEHVKLTDQSLAYMLQEVKREK